MKLKPDMIFRSRTGERHKLVGLIDKQGRPALMSCIDAGDFAPGELWIADGDFWATCTIDEVCQHIIDLEEIRDGVRDSLLGVSVERISELVQRQINDLDKLINGLKERSLL